MTAITVPGFFYLKKAESWETPVCIAGVNLAARWATVDMTGCDGVLLVAALTLTLDVPDDYDPRGAQVAALKTKQAEAAAAFHALTVEISRQINELQALEHTA